LDRLSYALIGAVLGALLAVACWWLYGLAFSLRYNGPGIDPQLLHWVKALGGVFAVLGFLLRDKVGSVVGDAFATILNFESDHTRTQHVSWWQAVFFLVVVAGLVWFFIGS